MHSAAPPFDDPAWQEVLDEHLGAAGVRQRLLADLVDGMPWRADLGAGTAAFGDPPTVGGGLQVLGTQAEADGSFVWSWANEMSVPPDGVLRGARWLRDAVGPTVAPFRTGRIADAGASAIHLTAVGSALLGLPLYRGLYPGGALYFAVEGLQLRPPTGADVVAAVHEALSSGAVQDHPRLVAGTARGIGWDVAVDVDGWVLGGGAVRVTFDEQQRVSGMAAQQG